MEKDDMKSIDDTLRFLFELQIMGGDEVICANGHHFHAGKYDWCPVCGAKFRTMTMDDWNRGDTDGNSRSIDTDSKKGF